MRKGDSETMTEEIKCQKYNSDFCFNECFYRGIGCAYEHIYPRKKKEGSSTMKKCDVKGCKEKAVWFSKTESLCTFHYQDKVKESYEKEAKPSA